MEFRAAAGAQVILADLDVAGDHVTIRGVRSLRDVSVTKARHVKVIDGQATRVWLQDAHSVEFRGGSYGGSVNVPILQVAGQPASSDLSFDGVDFHDAIATNSSAHIECLWVAGVDGFVVRNSIFRNCAYFGIFFTRLNGPDPKNVLLENNVFEATKQWNGQDAPYAVNLANWLSKAENFTFRNNTFGGDVAIQPDTIQNVRLTGNIGPIASCKDGVRYSHNVFSRAKCAASDKLVPDALSQFVDPVAHDWRLEFGAAAIDAADPLDYPATDRAGLSRLGAPDAGAHEYNGGGGGPLPDRQVPSVAVSSPAAGAQVNGSVEVAAAASDDTGVSGVQFKLDGADLGDEDTSAPYSISWNTTTASEGTHILSATARDAAGNIANAESVSVTVLNAPAPPPQSGLVAGFGFEERDGSAVTDASGLENNGTVAGAVRTAGRFGRGLRFDGLNDWVTVADAPSLDLTTGMTIGAWVKPDALSRWNTVIAKEQPGHITYSLYANTDSNLPTSEIWASNKYTLAGPSQMVAGRWTHIAATYDAPSLRLYLDGVLAGTLTGAGPLKTSANPLRIGGNSVWSEWFEGVIDEVRIYDRPLSADEIKADMNRAVQP